MFDQTKSLWIRPCCATIDPMHLLEKLNPQLVHNKFLASLPGDLRR